MDTDTTIKSDGTTTAASTTYHYDNDDLLTQKTTTGVTGAGANFYTYDGLSRLVTWLNPAGTTTSYGYDAASNRTSVTTPAGTRTSTFDERNRITTTTGASQPTDTYTWSPRGNITSATRNGATATYQFDAFERLVQTQKSPGYTVTFAYDSLDRAAQRNGLNFGYNDLTNNAILNPAAVGETKLLRDPAGTVLAAKTGSDPGNTVLGDGVHADTTATFTPATGNLTASTTFDPWGAPVAATGTNPLGFQAGITDPNTGLINAYTRWYDPTLGIFTSRDTYTLPPTPLPQANRYVYANDNPVTGTDPTGHMRTNDGGSSKPATLTAAQRRENDQEIQRLWNRHNTIEADNQRRRAQDAEEKARLRNRARSASPTVNIDDPTVYMCHTGIRCTDKLTYCAEADLHKMGLGEDPDYCLSDGGQVAVVPNLNTQYQQGDGVLSPLEWLRTWTGVPVSELRPDEIRYSLQRWFCYYNKITCDEQAAREWEALWKGLTGFGDAEDCYKAVTGQAGGSAWGCAWTVVNIAGFVVPFAKVVETGVDLGRGLRAGEAVAEAANGAGGVADAARVTDTAMSDVRLAASGACSFAATTPVLLADGTNRAIGQLKPGDVVIATDPVTGKTATRTVTGVWVHNDTVTNLNVAGQTIITTENHPFWNASHHQWQPARDLRPGDRLRTPTGTVATQGLDQSTHHNAPAYNLTVADTHTYYVIAGTTPVLVHNTACGPKLTIDSGQFGQKWGRHAADFGLDPSDATAREGFLNRIQSTYVNPEEVRVGSWNPMAGGGSGLHLL